MDRRSFLLASLAVYGCGKKDPPKQVATAPEAVPAPAAPPPPPPKTEPNKPKIPRVVFLSSAERPSTPAAPSRVGQAVLRSRLAELGHVEGKTILIDERYADGDPQRLKWIAHDIAQARYDVILAFGSAATAAARQATGTIPIVMVLGSDPVGSGLVASFARPGGNLTGTTSSTTSPWIGERQISLLREMKPGLANVGVLVNPSDADTASQLADVKDGARRLGIGVVVAEATRAEDIGKALTVLRDARPDGLVVITDPVLFANRSRVLEFAASNRLPASYCSTEMVRQGGLMSYAPFVWTPYFQAAVYVDKILKGARPGDLPIVPPSTFDLVINMKTARALGLTVPRSLALTASEVIH